MARTQKNTQPLTTAQRLSSIVKEVDVLKTLQAKTNVELDALLPSILDKAFKGEL